MTSPAQHLDVNLTKQFSLVISNELTVDTLILLAGGIWSPKEIGAKLGVSTSRASHHVKKLQRLGLVTLVEERDVGGSIQHFYRGLAPPIIDDAPWEELGIDQRLLYSAWILQWILKDAVAALNAKLFDAVPQRHLSRTPVVVDLQGFLEMASTMNDALSRNLDIAKRSAERLRESGDEGINVVAAMFCFQTANLHDALNFLEDEEDGKRDEDED